MPGAPLGAGCAGPGRGARRRAAGGERAGVSRGRLRPARPGARSPRRPAAGPGAAAARCRPAARAAGRPAAGTPPRPHPGAQVRGHPVGSGRPPGVRWGRSRSTRPGRRPGHVGQRAGPREDHVLQLRGRSGMYSVQTWNWVPIRCRGRSAGQSGGTGANAATSSSRERAADRRPARCRRRTGSSRSKWAATGAAMTSCPATRGPPARCPCRARPSRCVSGAQPLGRAVGAGEPLVPDHRAGAEVGRPACRPPRAGTRRAAPRRPPGRGWRR